MMHANGEKPFAPGQIWSLWDMQRIAANAMYELVRYLNDLGGIQIWVGESIDRHKPFSEGSKDDLELCEVALKKVVWVRKGLSALGARVADKEAARLERELADKSCSHHRLNEACRQIASRLEDELSGVRLYVLHEDANDLFRDGQDMFGSDVPLTFPSALYDIDEACKCLALERPTATVFHLMRALEVAASMIATKLGATVVDEYGRGLSWGVIATNIKHKVDKLQKGSPEQNKWYKVHAYLETVNRAWRVPTAHPKQTYTVDEAQAVLDATKAFMRELAPLAV
jgi:hypothetical protein